MPVYSILATTIIASLLALINIGSSTVFNDLISMTIAGFYGTYFTSCSLLLWRRCSGAIGDLPLEQDVSAPEKTRLTWGPWRIPGHLGIVNNVFACAYMIVIFFFSFWPPTNPTTPSTMNYSSLVFGAVILFSIAYYFAWGRKQYTGPVIEIDLSRSAP